MSAAPRPRTLLAATGALALTAALAGCGELTVLNPGSTASCEPDGAPVTLTTSQDASGEVLSIRYQGPSDLAVVFSYGYSLEDIPEAAETGAFAYAQSTSSDGQSATAYLLRLDPATDAGWSSVENGGMLDATFTGNIDELLDGRNAYLATSGGTSIGEIASAFLAVSCDVGLTSGEVDTLDSNAEAAPELLIAAPLNPGTVRLGPFVITSQSTVAGVTTGTMRFDAEAAEVFGDFVPSTVAEASLVLDVADVPDDTFSQLWFQEFLRDAPTVGTFEITSPITLEGEMSFRVTSSTAPESLPSDPLRLRIVFGNTDLGTSSALAAASAARDAEDVAELDLSALTPAAAGDAKAVFFETTFDDESGLSFGAVADESPAEELADTGVHLPHIGLAAGGLLLVVAGVAVAAARRARLG